MPASRPGSASRGPRRTAPARSGGPAARPGSAATQRPAVRPSGSRPASARGRQAVTEQRTPRSVRRAVILVSIFVMLAVTLVPTLRSYLRQQGEIAAMRAKVAQQQKDVNALKAERSQWDDPAFVQQQARERLKMVHVGDKTFTVLDGTPQSPAGKGPKVASVPSSAGRNHPWYGQLWQSMVIADNPPANPARLPASTAQTPK